MTPNAEAFKAANERSPVVEGTVIGRGGEGIIYRLKNGKQFELDASECEAVAPIRWDIRSPDQ